MVLSAKQRALADLKRKYRGNYGAEFKAERARIGATPYQIRRESVEAQSTLGTKESAMAQAALNAKAQAPTTQTKTVTVQERQAPPQDPEIRRPNMTRQSMTVGSGPDAIRKTQVNRYYDDVSSNVRLKRALPITFRKYPALGGRLSLTVQEREIPQDQKKPSTWEKLSEPLDPKKIPIIKDLPDTWGIARDETFKMYDFYADKLKRSDNKILQAIGGGTARATNLSRSFEAEMRRPSTIITTAGTNWALKGAGRVAGPLTSKINPATLSTIKKGAGAVALGTYGGYEGSQVIQGKKEPEEVVGQAAARALLWTAADQAPGYARELKSRSKTALTKAAINAKMSINRYNFRQSLKAQGLTFQQWQQQKATRALNNYYMKNGLPPVKEPPAMEQEIIINVAGGKPVVSSTFMNKRGSIGRGARPYPILKGLKPELSLETPTQTGYRPGAVQAPKTDWWYWRRAGPRIRPSQTPQVIEPQTTNILLVPGSSGSTSVKSTNILKPSQNPLQGIDPASALATNPKIDTTPATIAEPIPRFYPTQRPRKDAKVEQVPALGFSNALKPAQVVTPVMAPALRPIRPRIRPVIEPAPKLPRPTNPALWLPRRRSAPKRAPQAPRTPRNRPFMYFPTIKAAFLQETGNPIKGLLTGVEDRPIPKKKKRRL